MNQNIYFRNALFPLCVTVFLWTSMQSGDLYCSFPQNERGEAENIPDWQARWELARVLSYAGRLDEAVSEYQKLLRESPELYEAIIEYANVLNRSGRKKEALETVNSIPAAMVTDSTRLFIAQLFIETGNFDKAEIFYNQYLEKNPDDDVVRLKRAEVLSWQKKYQLSIDEYKRILRNRPGDVQVRRKYALVLSWAGKLSEAADQLKITLDSVETAGDTRSKSGGNNMTVAIENIVPLFNGGKTVSIQFDLLNVLKKSVISGYLIVEGITNSQMHVSFPKGLMSESGGITDYKNGDRFKIKARKSIKADFAGIKREELKTVIVHVFNENGDTLLKKEIQLKK